MPIIIYIFYNNFQDALFEKEKKFIKILMFSFILIPIGCYFGFWLSLYIFLPYLYSFSSQFGINNSSSLQSIIFFIINNMLVFGIMTQLPILIKYLIKLNIISKELLNKYNKHIILILLIISAIITPPDLLSMFVVFIPMYLFFTIGKYL